MAYIAFIAILIGAAGVAGGIEAESTVGTVDAALIYIGGVIAMALAIWKEKAEEGADPCGNTVDKHPGEEE